MMDVLVLYQNGVTTAMRLEERHLLAMQRAAGGHVYFYDGEESALREQVDAEVLVFWGGTGRMPERWCASSRRLRWMHTLSAGYDPIRASGLWHLPAVLTNTRAIHGKTVALTVQGYVIALLRRFPALYRSQTQHIWERPLCCIPEEAEGKTACIIGAGAIGCEIAAGLKALGLRVIGIKRHPVPLPQFDVVIDASGLQPLLPSIDFLIAAVPLTEETFHLIDSSILSAMKPEAFFINISRGGVVDEAALTAALLDGRLAGAALDVAEMEPLSTDSPLWDIENVMITPHMSAISSRYMDRAVVQLCQNLSRFRSGAKLFNEIQK